MIKKNDVEVVDDRGLKHGTFASHQAGNGSTK